VKTIWSLLDMQILLAYSHWRRSLSSWFKLFSFWTSWTSCTQKKKKLGASKYKIYKRRFEFSCPREVNWTSSNWL